MTATAVDLADTDIAFYTPPVLDASAVAGTLLRLRPVSIRAVLGAGRAWQVLYVSRDGRGNPIPVSGTVITPQGAGNLATGSLLVYQPSFHGLGGACAPSQLLAAGSEPDSEQIGAALGRGWTVAVPDGQGLGVIGRGPHTFLAGRASGQIMLDLVRAATRIPALRASNPSVVLWGYADGGRAAVCAVSLRPVYAPEVDLRGVAAGAVVTDLGPVVRHVNHSPWPVLGLAALLGLSCAHPHLPLRDVFTPDARRLLVDAEAASCVELCDRYRLPLGVWCERPDPWNDPVWRHVFALEHVPVRGVEVPVHLYHGDGDAIVPIAFTRRHYHRYRAHGVRVDWREYDADHFRTARLATADVVATLATDLARPPRP